MIYNDRYIPDHIRLTGKKKRKAPPSSRYKDPEMAEIRRMEESGEILVDHLTQGVIDIDNRRNAAKRRERALRKNKA